MFRFRTMVTLAATAVSLTVATFTPAQAQGSGGTSASNRPWYTSWEGYEYKCRFGQYQGRLYIDSVREATESGGSTGGSRSSQDCSYWEGTFYQYDQRGSQVGSYRCYGYARRGSYCYFKVEGSFNWVCMGQLSNDLRHLGGDVVDFDHCGYGHWFCEYWTDHSPNPQ